MRRLPVVEKLGWCWLLVSVEISQLSSASAFSTSWHRRAATQSTFRLSLSKTSRENQHNGSFVVIHVDDVSDKSNVPLTLEGLLESATEWRNTLHPSNCLLILVVDNNGSSIPLLHTGGPLDDNVGVFFSGNASKAHDVLLSLVQQNSSKHTMVVAADEELEQPFRQVSDKSTLLEFIEPDAFLRQVESLSNKNYTMRLGESRATDCVEESAERFD